MFPRLRALGSFGSGSFTLNSDKSFVVSKETDIRNKNKMFKGGAA